MVLPCSNKRKYALFSKLTIVALNEKNHAAQNWYDEIYLVIKS